jgi:NADH:ubiquinone oxidoreductase subunit D
MARYLVRMDEMEQSLPIIEQALDKLPAGPFINPKVPRLLKVPPATTPTPPRPAAAASWSASSPTVPTSLTA